MKLTCKFLGDKKFPEFDQKQTVIQASLTGAARRFM